MIASTQDINIKLLGKSIDLLSLKAKLRKSSEVALFKDALYVKFDSAPVFVFDYGVVVTWGLPIDGKIKLVDKIMASTSEKVTERQWESFHFEVIDTGDLVTRNDVFGTPNEDPMTLLAISHALAQSACLELFEDVAAAAIKDNNNLSQTLASTGKIPLSRKQLAMKRGALFITKADILQRFNLLDTPEFFWEYPEQEQHYRIAANYLELKPRVELLALKLQTIQDLLDMLATEQNHKHSAFLEWIIILLIAVDIVLYF